MGGSRESRLPLYVTFIRAAATLPAAAAAWPLPPPYGRGCAMLAVYCALALALAIGPTGVARTPGRISDQPPSADEAAAKLGVRAQWNAPQWAWSTAWRVGRSALPILHRWDDCKPTDTNVNLWVCWLKAIGGNRFWSGYRDGGLAYDLLPPVTRAVVARPAASLYPLLHHQNVLLRCAFLDQRVEAECARAAAAACPRRPFVR